MIHKFLFDWIKYPQSYTNKISKYADHMVSTKLTSNVYTKDKNRLFLQLEVMHHIKPDNVEYVLKTLGVGYKEGYIVPTVNSVVEDIAVLYTLEQIFKYDTRKIVKEKILQTVRKQLLKHKIEVDNINFTLEFTSRYKKLLEQKQLLEQKVQKMKLESELAKEEARRREKQKDDELAWEMKKATAQREQKLRDAKAERDAKILKAEGEVKALLKVQKIISENPQILRYLYINKLSKNVKVIVVPSGKEGIMFDQAVKELKEDSK